MTDERVREICEKLVENIETKHIGVFKGREKPLFLISEAYFGVWLEHVYDAITYAALFPEKGKEIAENTIRLFLDNQKENGQYPCYVWDAARSGLNDKKNVGFAQLQECVSFGRLCLEATKDDAALGERCYRSLEKWVGWLEKHRMTTKRGLVEVFVGYDTGHDNSGRLDGMRFPQNRNFFGREVNAGKRLGFDRVAPMLAVDVNCVFYGDLTALGAFAERFGQAEESKKWKDKAAAVKRELISRCFDKEDCFFYDVDRKDRKRKYLSSTVLHLFQEGVLDKTEDAALVREIFDRHVFNEKEFWTPYPFPSMAICDPSARTHRRYNDWGYFTQGNIVLRTTLWMDAYGKSAEQDEVCRKWLEAWTRCFDRMPVGQELDPVTGEPSPSSPYYSSGMLFFLYSAKRLGIL